MDEVEHTQMINGKLVICKPRPNCRVANMCENCAERGRLIVFDAECLLYGGLGGSRRVCDSHMKRENVIACPKCGDKAYFVELKNEHKELTGIGDYYCRDVSRCAWTSGTVLIPPKGVYVVDG